MENKVSYIDWEGPFSLKDMKKFNTKNDYGLYQVYGSHSVYGGNVLLYIGKTETQTFGNSIYNEGWKYYDNANGLRVYLGRFLSHEGFSATERSRQINRSFKLLIYAHSPAYNSEFINTFHNDKELKELTIINCKNYRDLLPEVSGKKWASGLGIILEKYKFKKLFVMDGFDLTAAFPAKA